MGLSDMDVEACLEGMTDSGQAFFACDAVEVRGAPPPWWWIWLRWWGNWLQGV
jgi:hypothetical protein